MVANKISKKICLLGDFAVGKTSLMRRFIYNRFDDKYISTIGVKVSRKTVVVPAEPEMTELTMMLWDLAGSEEFSQIRASYLRGSAGAVLVCDMTRAETLDNLPNYLADLHAVSPGARCILVANKIDLTDEYQITPAKIKKMAADMDMEYFLTSAKTGDEVETMFRALGHKLMA